MTTTTGVSSSSSSSDVDESNNPYLALRAAKIARNEARLRELGLIKTLPPPTIVATTAAAALSAQAAKGRKDAAAAGNKRKADASAAAAVDRSNLRRSKRHAPAIIVTPVTQITAAVAASSRHGMRGAALQSKAAKQDEVTLSQVVAITPLSSSPSLPANGLLAPNSARAIHLNVAKLVVSTENDEGLLGRVMAQTGKAFVMEEAARLAATETVSYDCYRSISFNKYSGVQEWGNALFLWINLGAPNCDVVNEFLDEGRRVTWFGGSRMHEKTRVIQRLMHEGQQQEQADSSTSSIALWCRRYQPTTKTFTPYTCMGRLSYHSHTAGSRPLAFCWNLLDYDGLAQHADDQVRQNFRYVIGL
jgi:hypothetical protein